MEWVAVTPRALERRHAPHRIAADQTRVRAIVRLHLDFDPGILRPFGHVSSRAIGALVDDLARIVSGPALAVARSWLRQRFRLSEASRRHDGPLQRSRQRDWMAKGCLLLRAWSQEASVMLLRLGVLFQVSQYLLALLNAPAGEIWEFSGLQMVTVPAIPAATACPG